MESLQVRKSFDRQAVFVLFALETYPSQVFGKRLTGALYFRTVCKCAVYAQRAIDWQHVHLASLTVISGFER